MNTLTKSISFKEEYCCTVVKINELIPIEGADKLVQLNVNGFSCVVSKDDFKVGDYAIYCKNETMINKEFLGANNLFDIESFDKNANHEIVANLIGEGKKEEARKNHCGFFNKHGRVKLIRLRGVPSYGFIFGKDALINWKPELKDIDLSQYINEDENGNIIPFDFDTVNGVEFIKVYMPPVQEQRRREGTSQERKRNKRLQKFNRLIDGEFKFHYDTSQLNCNMWRFKPDTNVLISNKLHGSSVIIGNVLTKIPIEYKGLKKVWNKVCEKLKLYKWRFNGFNVDYGTVYSSRKVVKNAKINPNAGKGFYDVDVWTEYGELFKEFIPNGQTWYGEIFGYVNETKFIQKNYDYGCKPGQNKIMFYRMKQKIGDKEIELNVQDVYNKTVELINYLKARAAYEDRPDLAEIANRIHPIDILYHGTFKDLYPELDVENHWNESVLECLKNDNEHFGMELDEPMCINKVPREGIVVRIDDDEKPEAFKLKCTKFLEKERNMIDNGEMDFEMEMGYNSEEETDEQ